MPTRLLLRQRAWATPRNLVVGVAAIGMLVTAGLVGRFTASVPLLASSSPPHVLVVMEENRGYAATLGTCSADPYLCSLASQYASVVGWTGVSHPSEPNYVAFESGGIQGCTTDTSCAAGSVKATDLGGQLTSAGVPWVSWQESMPSACYKPQTAPLYALKHSFGGFFADNYTGPCRIQPYPGSSAALATLNGASAPDFVWITPNLDHDMHNGTVQQGDAWLQSNLAPVLSSPWFTGFNSTVIITMDEHVGDTTGGGGAIPLVVISNTAQGLGNVSHTGSHYGTLRSIEEAYGLPFLGAASTTAHGDISALFGTGVTPTPTPSPTATPTPSPTTSPTASPTPPPSPTPNPSTVQCSGDITAALQAAVNRGGTVAISAGTCALSNHIAVSKAVTIDGAGQTQTFLVQHARVNIFQITAPGVTVEDMDVNTQTFNPGVPPILKNPVPGTIFTNANNTSVINVSSEAGTGFGIRFTGPGPCYTHTTSGDLAENVISTNLGKGGFTALDFDCMKDGTITNVTLYGASLSLFDSSNVVITGLTDHPDQYQMACAPPIVVTGPADSDSLINVLSYGGNIVTRNPRHGSVTNLTVVNFQKAPGDTC